MCLKPQLLNELKMNALMTLTDDELRTLCREALVNQPTNKQMTIPGCRIAIQNRCMSILNKRAIARSKPDFKARAAGMETKNEQHS